MKFNKIHILSSVALMFSLSACHDLDLNPLSSASSGNWNSTEEQVEMAVNDLYRVGFWRIDGYQRGDWSDDFFSRNILDVFENGTLNSGSSWVSQLWDRQYKAIARANSVINTADRALANGAKPDAIARLVAEAKFHRAAAYSKLIVKFGDLPLVLEDKTTDEGLTMGRTDKAVVLEQIYRDFGDAAAVLPVSYDGVIRATKGAALAFKARVSLIMGDWATAAASAKAVMDLGVYELHPNFEELFLPSTKSSKERVFTIPRALGYNSEVGDNGDMDDYWDYGSEDTSLYNELIRNAGGWAQRNPSWELLAAYTCTDGKPIDESPLFDPHNPFDNRDLRLAATIVPFGTVFLGYEFDPRPNVCKIMDYNKNVMKDNSDSYATTQYASFNGLYWKKGIDASWTQNGFKTNPDIMWIRYADVLLMYAEAKIELNQIDKSVVDAMNAVRARAYGVDPSQTADYPAFTAESQEAMRNHIRVERRMEFAKEGLRYTDMIRWRQAEKVMSRKIYGLVYPADECTRLLIDSGDWFWAVTPKIDPDGCADFTNLEATGKYRVLSERAWNSRMYLWPIPSKEIQINSNMKQNEGY